MIESIRKYKQENEGTIEWEKIDELENISPDEFENEDSNESIWHCIGAVVGEAWYTDIINCISNLFWSF